MKTGLPRLSTTRSVDKVVSAENAVALVRDGDTLCNAGFVGVGVPDELLLALAERFDRTGHPRDLTLLFAAGQGDGGERGLNRLAKRGMLRRVIGGHWGKIPKIGRLALDDAVEAWNLPQGCISMLYRDIAAGKPGTWSRVGLETFVDPRNGGGRINSRTTEDLVELVEVDGEEMLFYRAIPIDVAFIRATTADPQGNLTMEREALTLDALAMAMAARNSGGLVIAQVQRIAEAASLNPRLVEVPGVMVDCVVESRPEHHVQTYRTEHDAALSGQVRLSLAALPPMPLDARKIVARRAALELPPGGVVNLGIGMPEGVTVVAAEERVLAEVTLTAEPGIIGGIPGGGLDFGTARNPDSVIDQNQQFDFYEGGGLDLACLGMAECDGDGNVNVSRFGDRLAGAGGFINISQNARTVAFLGTFTAGGLDVAVEDGALRIVREGRVRKFVPAVEQITFSGRRARRLGTPVLYITERCVFRLTPEGMTLAEVAPGIDVERDILGQMGFEPVVREPATMAPAIFRQAVMGLAEAFGARPAEDRVTVDRARGLVFVDLEGMHVHTEAQVDELHAVVLRACGGARWRAVINLDAVVLSPEVSGAFRGLLDRMDGEWFDRLTRYPGGAFRRMRDAGGPRERASPTGRR